MESNEGPDRQALTSLCHEAAQRNGVSPDVHPLDFIFRFIVEHPAFDNDAARIDYYFDDGAKSAQSLAKLISETCGLDTSSVRLLEFASGYGCVTRHLPNTLPGASITSCDIHRDAVEFIERTVGVRGILSDSVPEKLELDTEYDVIFALSFFSHMPKTSWARWLNVLASGLRKGGYLIFTTHGQLNGELHLGSPELDSDGFWFQASSEQKDLDTSEYGNTLTTPTFVASRIGENPDVRLAHFSEAFWWRLQDLYVVRRLDV